MQDTLILDLRYALRQARRHRGSTLAAFLVLTACIAATTALFSVMSGIILRPLPVKDTGRIVRISEIDTRTGGDLKVSMTDFADWKARAKSFAALALYRINQGNWTGTHSPERVRIMESDTALLPLLGITPVRGRSFAPNQTQPGRANEALLTWPFWKSRFGGQDVLGRQIVIDEKPYTIVGVLPDLLLTFGQEDVWLPLELDLKKRENGRGYHWYYVLGRLAAGVTLKQANNEVSAIAASLAAEYPSRNQAVGARTRDFRESITGNYRPALLLLFAFAATVLLIACVNVASLTLARASGRQREISIRLALGASRINLFRQVLTESLLLSCAAALVGMVLAIVMVRTVTRLPVLNIPLAHNIHIDWRVLLFTTGIALLTGIGFGLAPALRASFVDVNDALKQSGTRNTESRSRQNFNRSFVFLQSGLAALLLVISGLLLKSFVNASHVDVGFKADHLLTVHISLPASRLDFDHPGKVGLFARDVLMRIRALPGIDDAAIATDLPLTGTGGGAGVLVEGKPQRGSPFSAPYAQWTLISPGYFHTLRIPLLRGRDFEERDRQDSATVAIVNNAFVRRFLNGQPPIAKRIALASDPSRYRQIIGVVGDVPQLGMEKEVIPQVFFSINQLEDSWLAIVARTRGEPINYVAPIRAAVQKVDPEIAVFLPRTMGQIISLQKGWRIFETSLVGAFALVAMLLAAVGTYAVISYSVAQRAQEIGIRMALGATGRHVLRSFVFQGAAPAIFGAILGAAAGFGTAQVIASLLYGVTPNDIATYLAAVTILVAVALAASYIPARRAARLEPSRALRYE